MAADRLIEVVELQKTFVTRGSMGRMNEIRAVDGVTFHIEKGETFGLVGESGCGKTTLGRTIVRLYDATGGQILFEGRDIASLEKEALKPYRRRMQTIFQDPYSSLNPYMNVEQLIAESLNLSQKLSKSERLCRVEQILLRVGLHADDMEKYPHEFSGGQRQRIGVARALVVEPDFVLCDEPISALDVSIQAQIVNLLEDLQQNMGLTYLFVAHDLSMVRYISKRIGVMYMGWIVEIIPAQELYANPLHPYTKALLSAIPVPDPKKARGQKRVILKGDPSDALMSQKGCSFYGRCPMEKPECMEERPALVEYAPGHLVACLRVL